MEEEAAKKKKAMQEDDEDQKMKDEDESKEEKKEEENGDEKKSNKQQPNPGNGGETDKYYWIQTLDDLTVFVKLPDNVRSNQLDVVFNQTKIKAGVKG